MIANIVQNFGSIKCSQNSVRFDIGSIGPFTTEETVFAFTRDKFVACTEIFKPLNQNKEFLNIMSSISVNSFEDTAKIILD